MRRFAILVTLGLAACGSDPPAGPAPAPSPPATPARPPVPTVAEGSGGPERCAACHTPQAEAWKHSGHAVAVRPASRAIFPWTPPVTQTEHLGPVPASIEWRDGAAWCRSRDLQGKPKDYRITHVVGGRVRERYLTDKDPDGRAWALPLEYDHRVKRFRPFWSPKIARQPTPLPPEDARYWHGRQENFSAICFRCHTPGTRFTYDPDAGRYTVDWGRPDEVGVQCTACHGDARLHATVAQAGHPPPLPPRQPYASGRPEHQVAACGRCHVTGEVLAPGYEPGGNFFDAFQPIVMDDTGRFWPDGLRKQEAYSFLAHNLSSCYLRGGLNCTACHDPHGDRDRSITVQRSETACARCHPKLPFSCDSHGKPGDAARTATCVDCHMARIPVIESARTMHDHRILAPDPALTALIGIPNACAGCHEDRDAAWAETAVESWGAKPRPRRAWALAVEAGLRGAPDAGPRLVAMLEDPKVPWPIAATAGRLLLRYPSEPAAAALRRTLAGHAHPMVRSAAAYGLVGKGEPVTMAALQKGLDDPVRAVRLMSATALIVLRDPDGRESAVREIDALLARIPDDVALRRLRAYASEQAGDLEGALAEYARARRCAPNDPALAAAEAACKKRAEGK